VRLPSRARKRHPVNAYRGSITSGHGRKGTWMRTDKKGCSGPTSSQSFAGTGRCHHDGQNNARQTRRRWKLWTWHAAQQSLAAPLATGCSSHASSTKPDLAGQLARGQYGASWSQFVAVPVRRGGWQFALRRSVRSRPKQMNG
jgi:hypothetical protein